MRFVLSTLIAAAILFSARASSALARGADFEPATSPSSLPSLSPATQPDESALIEPKRISFDVNVATDLTVQKTASGHLLVPARVNGKDAGWFILDTGAGISCIDQAVADELKLAVAGDITARGVGGERASKLRSYQTLSVGPVIVEDGALLELNLKPYALLMGAKIAGIIGHECFDGGVFDMNFATSKITIHDPAKYHLDAGSARWQPMQVVGRRPAIRGTIESGKPGLFILDTGSDQAILVHAPAVKRLGLLKDRKTSRTIAGGVGGMKMARRGTLAHVMLGTLDIPDVAATFGESTDGVISADDSMATVGLALFRDLRIILNQSARTVAVEQLASVPAAKPATQAQK